MIKLKWAICSFLIISLVIISPFVNAKEIKQPDREEIYSRYLRWPSLVKNWKIDATWLADGSSFWYTLMEPEAVIYRVDPIANTKSRLEKAPLQSKFYKLYKGAPEPGELRSPDGKRIALIQDHNLWLRSLSDNTRVQLTKDGKKEYGWSVDGMQDWTWLAGGHVPHSSWSSDGMKLALKKMDRRKIDAIPLVHWLGSKVEVEWIYYARAGKPIAQSELWVIDITSGKLTQINSGKERDLQLPILGWSHDSSVLYFLRGTRDHKKREIVAADIETGATRIVLSETGSTFLSLARASFWMLDDSERFLWLSERDGWNHLYLYSVDGTLIRRLTKGAFPVMNVLAVDEDGGWVYFLSHGDQKRPYDTHLYRVNLNGQGFKQLTEKTGQHTIEFSPSKKFFLDRHSTIDRPPVTELRHADGTYMQTLAEANIEALEELKFIPGEEFVVKALDGKTDLWGAIYKPYDFDPRKKYPVVDYISTGPIETQVPRTFVHSSSYQAWAQLGFIVVVVDHRGTAERGKSFQDVIYKKWGSFEIDEHTEVLKQLAAERSYMDMERIGIVGYSWGGYYALRALLTAPQIYKVGVAVEPDLILSEITWDGIEPYLGLPENNLQAWESTSNLSLISRLKGKLLLIQGTNDRISAMHITMKMVDALIKEGKMFDMLIVPELGHTRRTTSPNYRYAGAYVWQKVIPQYLQEHLKPERGVGSVK
jgi:dipeptidyl aminopeptidase/acylaminoacyl peptidase